PRGHRPRSAGRSALGPEGRRRARRHRAVQPGLAAELRLVALPARPLAAARRQRLNASTDPAIPMKGRSMFRTLFSVMAPPLLGGLGAAAHADDKLVVTAFGGIWQQSIEKNFASCYRQQTGNEVAIQLGDPAGWINRIRANPGRPPIDVVTLA